MESVVIVGNAPLPGTNIDPDKIAGEVQTLSASDLVGGRQTDIVANAMANELSSVSVNHEQGSQFQPDFVYRGFEASPISGVAEGVAVYQNGLRLNEAFGDNVNWDLVPEFAIDRITVQSNNPTFGLNAIGGAVSISMKNGMTFDGAEAELTGGSYGNLTGNAEYGIRLGKLSMYLGLGGVTDNGFRYRSATRIRQFYGDIGYETGKVTLHLALSAVRNDIAAPGPTPVELLARDRKAVFTYPQSMRNRMRFAQFRGTYTTSNVLTFSVDAYYRSFLQNLMDGNTTDIANCRNNPAQLCLEGNYNYPTDALYSALGAPVLTSVLPPGATPGETDYTRTDSGTIGSAVQMSFSAPIGGRTNSFVTGASLDSGTTHYTAHGELGTLADSLGVIGAGIIIDQALSPAAQPPIIAPVNVDSRNTYIGLYAIDVFDLLPYLSWTLSGRLNLADIRLKDRLGGTISGKHSYAHVNPGTGFAYKIDSSVTAYAGYSQANRTPTPGELSCADPASPCLLDAFLVSDPQLKQVVSHNIEMGLRGKFAAPVIPYPLSWNVSAFRTDADHDILLLATNINGFGYFQNAGTTRRQGIDIRLGYRSPNWHVTASYSHLDATFRDAQTLSSNSPAADAQGLIHVRPGDHLPMIPTNRLTLSVDYAAASSWSLGTELRMQSGQYLVGDESNQEPKLPGFATVNIHTSCELGSHYRIFAEVKNLFDKRYYTYGTFVALEGLPPGISLSDPRTYSPAAGRTFFAGVRARLD